MRLRNGHGLRVRYISVRGWIPEVANTDSTWRMKSCEPSGRRNGLSGSASAKWQGAGAWIPLLSDFQRSWIRVLETVVDPAHVWQHAAVATALDKIVDDALNAPKSITLLTGTEFAK